MSLSSFLRGIIDRFRMACVYNDDYMRAFEGIEEGAIILVDIKLKWKMESEKNVCTLWAMKEREHQANKAQLEYAEGLELVKAFPVPVKVKPVPIDKATNTPNALKQIQVDLAELRKHVKEWETADDVFNNLAHFKEWLPRTQWAFKDKAQIYLLYNTLPPNLHKQLLKVEWTKHCAASHATKGSLQTLEDWILSWRHVRPRTKTALSALYSGELKQGLKEQLYTWYEKIQEVGEDAFGPNKYMWSLTQRRLVAQAFIKGCRHPKARAAQKIKSKVTQWFLWCVMLIQERNGTKKNLR